MITKAQANRTLPAPQNYEVVTYENGSIHQIINTIMAAHIFAIEQTRDFANSIHEGGTYKTCKELWRFTREHIKYVRDTSGHEQIKFPSWIWHVKQGDCKSMSLFIGSILANKGYYMGYRLTFPDKVNYPDQAHIYPWVEVGGKRIWVDAVNSRFDAQDKFSEKYDFQFEESLI